MKTYFCLKVNNPHFGEQIHIIIIEWYLGQIVLIKIQIHRTFENLLLSEMFSDKKATLKCWLKIAV